MEAGDQNGETPTLYRRLWGKVVKNRRGVTIAVIGGLSAMWISEHYNAPAMLIALLLGLALHFLHEDPRVAVGLDWAAQNLLRLGIVLLGFRIAFSDILQGGLLAPALVVVAMAASFGVGVFGARLLGVSSGFGRLSAGAVAICGVSAAAAIAAVLPRRDRADEELTIVVVSVTALSTLAMILYPTVASVLRFDDHMAGVFIGGSIHDVAQVIGAGYSISDEAGDTATYVKLFRVALLLPVVWGISLLTKNRETPGGRGGRLVPSFLIGFLLLATINSFGVFSDGLAQRGADFSRGLLVVAIFAIGARTDLKAVLSVGPRPLILMGAETVAMALVLAVGLVLFGRL